MNTGAAGSAGVAGSGGSGGDAPVAGAAGAAGAESAPAAECAINTDCASASLCVHMPGTAVGTCRPRCSPTEVGSQGACNEDEICAFDAGGSTPSCQRICDPTAPESGGCPALDGCFADPSPTLTSEIVVPGLCVRVGTLEAGAACEQGACAAGLECLTTMDGAGIGYCAAWCAPTAEDDAAGSCPAGQECEVGTTGRTGCVERCAPLGSGECPDELMCSALAGGGLGSEDGGRCVAPGAAEAGAPCDPGECAEGLLCTGWPTPLTTGERLCSELCVPSSPNPCLVGTCIPLATSGGDIGTCHETCEPLAEGAAAGCPEDEWCAPSTTLPEVGVCVPATGTVAAGEACSRQSECSAGTYCECRFGSDAFCETEASCRPICIPGVPSGEPGDCPSGQSCSVASNAGVRYPFGVCRAECELGAAATSCPEEETCVSSTLTGSDSDACADIPLPLPALGDDCPSPPFNIGELCGESALCVQWESLELPRCSQLCLFSNGAAGTSPHPDCADASETCTAIAGETEFGYCR